MQYDQLSEQELSFLFDVPTLCFIRRSPLYVPFARFWWS